MLRLLTFVLLLANGLYLAWSQGVLPGLTSREQSEPQRLLLQLKPQSLQLLTVQDVRQIEAAAAQAKSPQCLQAGPFDEPQAAALRAALVSALPAGSWSLGPAPETSRWIVYMGKYASREALAKKRSELDSLKLRFEPLTDPSLQWGLSLGGHETQAAANAALISFNQRGVRTARVLQERTPGRGLFLRLPATDDALRPRLSELNVLLGDKLLLPCVK